MLLGYEDNENELRQHKVESVATDSELDIKEAVISMHATHRNLFMQTMKFKGQIGKNSIYALIDSGSTHSFVDPVVLQSQHFTVKVTKPLIVMTANGQRMVTDTHYTSLTFSLQGNTFTGDLQLLQIQGHDMMILGLD
jgi:Retroviral aspartyl protease